MSKLSFDVTGMHCASCAAAVERAVKKQDERRLAVLEERSTIARELHDSIA